MSAVKRVGFEVLGWVLLGLGIAALVLPGPGLLLLFAGLAVLSQQYDWAERRLRPAEEAARKAARDSVQTWPRLLASLAGVSWLIGLGVVWVLDPPVPSWWGLPDWLWLPGGSATGGTLIASGLLALGMIVYSYRHYRGVDDVDAGDSVGADSDG